MKFLGKITALSFLHVAALFFYSSRIFAAEMPEDLQQKIGSLEKKSGFMGVMENARKVLRERVGCKVGGEQTVDQISRTEWEELLRSNGQLSAHELRLLQEFHRAIITEAKEKYRQESKNPGGNGVQYAINFADFRAQPNAKTIVQKFCASVPKGGMLHVHPLGTLDVKTIKDFLKQKNPHFTLERLLKSMSAKNGSISTCDARLIYSLNLPESGRMYNSFQEKEKRILAELGVLIQETEPFPVFQARFGYIRDFLPGVAEAATKIFLERAKSQKVSYVELTELCPEDKAELLKLNEQMTALSRETGVKVNYNCAFARGIDPLKNALRAQKLFLHFKEILSEQAGKSNFVGIDVFGKESATVGGADPRALESGQAIYACYQKWKEDSRILRGCTFHAGEHGDATNPRDALILCGDRLGHGLALRKDPLALEYARQRKTAVEINLVSNVRLGAVGPIQTHPFLDYLRLGLPVSLSTDDEGIFETSMNRECREAILNSDISYAELKQMAMNSLATSFAASEEKEVLLKQLRESFAEFERTRPWEAADAAMDTATPERSSELSAYAESCSVSSH